MFRGVRTAAPFLLTTGLSLVVLFFDRFVVASYRGLAAVGVYTFFASVTFALHTVIHNGVALFRLPTGHPFAEVITGPKWLSRPTRFAHLFSFDHRKRRGPRREASRVK